MVYFSGISGTYGCCTLIVSFDIEHVSDNTWVADQDSYVKPSHDAPATHEEHTHCTLCGGIAETRTVVDALIVNEVKLTMPELKEGDGYTIQYDENTGSNSALPRPVVKVPDGVNYHAIVTSWSEPTETGYGDVTEDRTFQKGDEVLITVLLSPSEGYNFPFEDPIEEDPDVDITIEGGELESKSLISGRVTDPETGEIGYATLLGLVIKVTVPRDTSPATGQYEVNAYLAAAAASVLIISAYALVYRRRAGRK